MDPVTVTIVDTTLPGMEGLEDLVGTLPHIFITLPGPRGRVEDADKNTRPDVPGQGTINYPNIDTKYHTPNAKPTSHTYDVAPGTIAKIRKDLKDKAGKDTLYLPKSNNCGHWVAWFLDHYGIDGGLKLWMEIMGCWLPRNSDRCRIRSKERTIEDYYNLPAPTDLPDSSNPPGTLTA